MRRYLLSFILCLLYVVFIASFSAKAADHCTDLTSIDINTAPAEDLQCIAHIGPSRAEQAIALRTQELFISLDDLQKITGIGGPGSTTLEDIKSQGFAVVLTQEESAVEETVETTTSSSSCIDINTAPKEELQRISGVGEVIGQRIIQARPFSSLDDLARVEGIGEVTLTSIKEEGFTCVLNDSRATNSVSASTQNNSISNPIISRPGGDLAAAVGDTVTFDARASEGAERYTWYLGDGTVKKGRTVVHAYQFPGTYVVTLEAAKGVRSAVAHKYVYVFGGGVVVSEVYVPATGEQGWLELFNTGSTAVNLGGWSIRMGEAVFSLPTHTTIAPYTFLTLPASVTGLVPATAAVVELFYPNGARADEVAFGALRPGQAIARTNAGFYWTTTPTPGGVNSVFSPPATVAYSDTLPYVEEVAPEAGTSTIPASVAEVSEQEPRSAFEADILETVKQNRFSLPSLSVPGAAVGVGALSLFAGVGYVLVRRRRIG